MFRRVLSVPLAPRELPEAALKDFRSAGLSKPGSPSARAASSQAMNPGTGDRVANVVKPGNSRARVPATRLIRKLPKLMPASPFWALEME